LTARGLAYWFMDDGCSFQIKQKCYLVFSTNSSSLADQQKLVEALRDRFEISATIQKHYSYYRLYIRSKSTERFVDLIGIHPCFDSKIQNN
jgi:hypothetical protein